MPRSTKIVATLGPASNSPEMLSRLIAAGVDVVRLNFSHGEAADHIERARIVREQAAIQGRAVGIMVDLQGPKIRIGKFRDGRTTLAPRASFVLDTPCTERDAEHVGLDYPDLVPDVAPAAA